MFLRKLVFVFLLFGLGTATCRAQAFGTVRGIVEDSQQGAIVGAKVTLKAQASAWTKETETDGTGTFIVSAVPAGQYMIQIEKAGFRNINQLLTVTIGSAPILHLEFPMELEGISSAVEVTASPEAINPEASSPPIMVSDQDIQHVPGAERTSSLAYITDFVPGTYLLHDHLHMRGGHQVSWLVDGVPVPNTNISSNVGRAMDPKDMETVEVQRGGYSAKSGDRTFGMINIIPRSGFEFSGREAELTVSYGTQNQTNDQLSFGGHSDKFAYYGSLTGNRTDLGLEPPTTQIVHNLGSGLAGFTSLSYNVTNSDQLRLAASLRKDHFQVPIDPSDPNSAPLRDVDQEVDSFLNFSWVHTIDPSTLLTVSPLYHFNRSEYNGGLSDPLITVDHRSSQYVGGQVTLGIVRGKHNFTVGLYGFREHDERNFHLVDQVTGPAPIVSDDSEPATGGLGALYLDEQFKATSWLTFNGGLRLTHFSGKVNENAADPRIGAAIQIPRLNWVLRGFYGRYYQAPPLETISGPVLSFETAQTGVTFLPVPGERDEQHEFGLTIPVRGWVLDLAHFRTFARNFSDHDVLGNSNITLPLSIQFVTVRGWEAVVRSPQVWRRVHFHLAFSNQVVKGQGTVTGGLTNFAPPTSGFFYIDHDQRNTLTTGGEVALPWRSWANVNYVFGSGFLDQNGPQHLPPHHSADISLGKSFGESFSVTVSALNIANSRFLFGRDSSFAGTHYNDPRQIIVSVHYRFHW